MPEVDDGPIDLGDSMAYDQLATRFLVASSHKGVRTIHYWRDTFWLWSKHTPVYTPVPEKEMVDEILQWMRTKGLSSVLETANRVMACVRADTRRRDIENMPTWLGTKNSHVNHIALASGIVDPIDIVKGRNNILMKHTPLLFTRTKLPYKYVSGAPCVAWLSFLDECFPNDPEAIALLQEWFGYVLTPETKRQVALFLIGPENTGKSTTLRIMRALLGGVVNCTFLSADELGEDFALAAATNKTLVISDEMRKQVSSRTESVFKWFVGGLEMNNNDKYKSRMDNDKAPTARLVVAANEFPEFKDPTGAVYRRILPLRMDCIVPIHRRDPDLESRLRKELPGIFNWAIQGLKRLLRDGWTKCETGLSLMSHMRMRNQGWTGFLDDCVVASANSFTTNERLLDMWNKWTTANGVATKGITIDLLKGEIIKRVPTGELARMRVVKGGKQERGISGVRVAY